MKRTGRMALKAVLAAAFIVNIFLFSGCSKDTGPIQLKLAHFFPGTHPVETRLVAEWKKAVEAATGGRVVVVSYPGETLLKAPDVYDGVVKGVADVGISCFSYTRGRFPVLEAFELPGLVYKDSKTASQIAWDGIRALNPKEVQDTRLQMVIATGPGVLFTRAPVRELKDLSGMEIRATGLSAKTLKLLGAVPVGMPQSEAYEALSKGIVKGNLAPAEVLKGWRHAEVTKHITHTPFLYNTLFFMTMNNARWAAMPADIRDAITRVNDSLFETMAAGLWDSQNGPALEWAVAEKGLDTLSLSADETARWITAIKPVQDDFVKDLAAKSLPGAQILATVDSLVRVHGAQP